MSGTWVEVSERRVARNLASIRRRLPSDTQLVAVVKANAYGHGTRPALRALLEPGIEDFVVATLEEAIEARGWARAASILVLGGCAPGQEKEFLQHDLTAAVFDDRPLPPSLKVQVKIDTGMTRLGIGWQEAPEFLRRCRLDIRGVYSHFASPETDEEFTKLQLGRFLEVTRGLSCPRHIAASAALAFPETALDAVRIGLALYGIPPRSDLEGLQPALSWKSRLISVKDVPAGNRVGYGGTFLTHRPSRLGILPVGYADGYSRGLSNQGKVRVGRALAPLAGRVSMDFTTIDLTNVPEAEPGDEVTLLEAESDSPISAAALADMLGTIPYEILTSIGPRVERVWV